ncbi:MAG: DUF368 domain-containing protein [Thermoplasmata archaeon]
MKLVDACKRVLDGFIIGMANIIPGVSGGTMALIMGIYDRLIHAINTIPLTSPKHIIKGEFSEFKKKIMDIDYDLLLPLGIGIFIATLSGARVIEYLLDSYTAVTYSFFFGLIMASVGVIYKYIEKIDASNIGSAALGFLFAFFFVGLNPIQSNHSLPVIFFSGALAIISMILPGISGSFILVFLQQYHFMITALNDLDMPVIIVFLGGAFSGLFGFSKLLDFLIQHKRSVTMSFLFGLMLGALRVPITKAVSSNPSMLEVVIPAAVGALIVSILELHYVKR